MDALLDAHETCMAQLRHMKEPIVKAGRLLRERLDAGNTIMICGNGGSAADAQHFSSELVGHFQTEREGFPAIALTTDTSILTSVGNDYGVKDVFVRQVRALGRPHDVLIAISTSGNSDNVLRAVHAANERDITTLGMLGRDGGALAQACTMSLVVPEQVTARVQEAHIFLIHALVEIIEDTESA
jgi:D-sedoheptulose 7-phosphate isomerase